jgi:hypothetical protein
VPKQAFDRRRFTDLGRVVLAMHDEAPSTARMPNRAANERRHFSN